MPEQKTPRSARFKKEKYLSSETLRMDAQKLCRGMRLSTLNDLEKIASERSALLVLDMQRYFLDPSSHAFIPSAKAIIPGIRELIRRFQAAGLPVIFTRHLNTPQNAGQMALWWKDLIRSENPLSLIFHELHYPEIPVMDKSQYDAFHNTSLEEMLQKRSVTQVVICGVMTHLCCDTTARSAFMRGYKVIFSVDGTATYNRQLHRATLLTLSHGFAHLACINDLTNLIGGITGAKAKI